MTAIILETNTEAYSIIRHNISLPRDSTPSISWSKSNLLVHPKTIYAPQASHILWRSSWVCVVGPQVDQLMIQHCLYFILVLYILRHEKQACFLQFLIIQPHNHGICSIFRIITSRWFSSAISDSVSDMLCFHFIAWCSTALVLFCRSQFPCRFIFRF